MQIILVSTGFYLMQVYRGHTIKKSICLSYRQTHNLTGHSGKKQKEGRVSEKILKMF